MDRPGRPTQFIRCSARALHDLWPRWGRRLFRGALCHKIPDSRFDSLASVPVTAFLPTPPHYRLGVYYESSGEPCVTASRARTAQVRAGGSQRRIEGMLRSPTVLPLIYVRPVPLRPIFRACGTATYALAKFLVPLLSPVSENEFTVKNSYQFVEDVRSFRLSKDMVMASFDVESLFTNIPVRETINIAIDSLFKQCVSVKGISRKLFRSMLDIAVTNFFPVWQKTVQTAGRRRNGLTSWSHLCKHFLVLSRKELAHCLPTWFSPCFIQKVRRWLFPCFWPYITCR